MTRYPKGEMTRGICRKLACGALTLALTTILLAASASSLFAQARSNIQITATVVRAAPALAVTQALVREAALFPNALTGVRELLNGLANVRTEAVEPPGAATRRRARITVEYAAN